MLKCQNAFFMLKTDQRIIIIISSWRLPGSIVCICSYQIKLRERQQSPRELGPSGNNWWKQSKSKTIRVWVMMEREHWNKKILYWQGQRSVSRVQLHRPHYFCHRCSAMCLRKEYTEFMYSGPSNPTHKHTLYSNNKYEASRPKPRNSAKVCTFKATFPPLAHIVTGSVEMSKAWLTFKQEMKYHPYPSSSPCSPCCCCCCLLLVGFQGRNSQKHKVN